MKDVLELTILFDCYSGMLTEKQRLCFDLYYNQDLSLSEIAEECGISRQGVHDTLSRTEASLLTMEEQLGCGAREHRLRKAAQELLSAAAQLESTEPAIADRIRRSVELLEKE